MRRPVVEALARTMIQFFHDFRKCFLSHGSKVQALGEVPFKAVVIIAAVAITSGAASAAYATSTAAATGATVGSAAYTTAYTAAAASTTASVIGGAAGGFTGGLLASKGDINAALKGAVTGGIFGGLDSYATINKFSSFQTVAANATVGGVTTKLQGGSFEDGFKYSGLSAGASEAYKYVVGYAANPLPGEQIPSGKYYPDSEGQLLAPAGYDVFGTNQKLSGNFFGDFLKQGGTLSRIANLFPGANALAAFHDDIFNQGYVANFNTFTNIGTMLPAAAITYTALLRGPLSVQLAIKNR